MHCDTILLKLCICIAIVFNCTFFARMNVYNDGQQLSMCISVYIYINICITYIGMYIVILYVNICHTLLGRVCPRFFNHLFDKILDARIAEDVCKILPPHWVSRFITGGTSMVGTRRLICAVSCELFLVNDGC